MKPTRKNAKTVRLVLPYRPVRGEMNRTEERYARHLDILKANGDVLEYMFEPVTFRLATRTSYTPDFMVICEDRVEFHEVKGYWQEDAWIKFKTIADRHPWARWVIVTWDKKNKNWKTEEYGGGNGRTETI